MNDISGGQGGTAFAVARTVDMADLISKVAETHSRVSQIGDAVTDIQSVLGSDANGHGIRGRLRKLEDAQQFRAGAVWAIHIIWTMLAVGMGYLIAHWHGIVAALSVR